MKSGVKIWGKRAVTAADDSEDLVVGVYSPK